MTKPKPRVGSLVRVRLARTQGGASKVSPGDPSYRTYPEVRCRIAQVAVGGVPDTFALEYLDGKPVGLPFQEEEFLEVVPGRRGEPVAIATVYHEITPRFGMGKPVPFDAAHYQPVANIETADPEAAFRLTNSIDAPWYDSPGVLVLAPKPQVRSTSVGDIIVIKQGAVSRAYRCDAVGWTQL